MADALAAYIADIIRDTLQALSQQTLCLHSTLQSRN
ncbi:hypothetical protein AZE42_06803 [Rhizopogon vesiculosus]|uniref:Uncharacterized protein n=1 Tax=Rhizopogon vesiculosus TaxID=180088 RepID=A0A1J8QXD0_9AGAM|nr:hypothetical protein AZE42_06803 [Rhizopogon vesiculosus]